jgi:hypothetical protein
VNVASDTAVLVGNVGAARQSHLRRHRHTQ